MTRLIRGKIVPWEVDYFGVSLEWENGRHEAYRVGDWLEAHRELKRLKHQQKANVEIEPKVISLNTSTK